MYDATEIALRINQLLKEKQLSQKDMLEKCDLSKNAISSMLSRGSMLRADNLARIADYLDCSIDYLMGRNHTSSGYRNQWRNGPRQPGTSCYLLHRSRPRF